MPENPNSRSSQRRPSAFDADLVESELSRMNSAADEINILENKLNKKRKIHEKLVLNFTTDLGNVKAKVTTEQIQNSAEFYQKMKEGDRLKNILSEKKNQLEKLTDVIELIEATLARTKSSVSGREIANKKLRDLRQKIVAKESLEQEINELDAEHRHNLIEARVQAKKHPFNIRKTKNFFMIKWKGEDEIHSASVEIEELSRLLVTQKENYTNAMRNLEVYSGKVHAKRSNSQMSTNSS
ncbi:Oidioi.mRNA.OKI2018_I69.chr1.g1895.t2.cds [Oikopleura dioica]|uniref:Oidioi.mRNA.OKI2018_I69.chr1.g1895.t2.cds n=1 Tax=Oikopleura dioica TaxID=34765 RepID=A0ABN7STK0_OIKDI|nr:Oidioi.mRNA.OKI2018_I69.chr1.g1895.t2.cds [Oikopleura dioica]